VTKPTSPYPLEYIKKIKLKILKQKKGRNERLDGAEKCVEVFFF
jgi:hypothetical protein